MTTAPFTVDQLAKFQRYVKVQRSNRFNMLDPRAAQAAQLTRDEMVFIMDNYEALERANANVLVRNAP